MKPEKMTEEAHKAILAQSRDGGCIWRNSAVRRLLAHIAALEAERDEKAVALDSALSDATRLLAERDALREQVRALEAKANHFERVAKGADLNWLKACERADAAESRLAAIRQRAGDVRALNWSITSEARDTYQGLEEGAHMEPRGELWTRWAVAVARYLLGDDAVAPVEGNLKLPSNSETPTAPPEAFTHEKGLDAGTFEEAPESTTAEAFASARGAVRDAKRGASLAGERALEHVERNLSLVERRMGAMARALQLTLTLHHRMPGDVIAQIQAAITDAPAVFTLEEVENVARGVLTDAGEDVLSTGIILGALKERLLTLRK